MCAGAILNAHLPRVDFGACDPKSGAAGSLADLLHLPGCFQPEVSGGILEAECSQALRDFSAHCAKVTADVLNQRLPHARP